MKKFTCLLLSILIFATPILAQNPCEDSTYLELKQKKLDDLSDREYEYFTRKDKECSSVHNNTAIQLNLETLNAEQKIIYQRQRLIIKKRPGGFTATWMVFRGSKQISEEEFLRIVGYDKEADLSKKHQLKIKKMAWSSLIIGLAGIPLIVKGSKMEDTAYDNWSSTQQYHEDNAAAGRVIGLGVITTTGGLTGSAIFLLDKYPTKYGYLFVENLYEDYNQKLIQEIKGTTP